MASTTITYGKKRGLFQSLGSRRRQRLVVETAMPIKQSDSQTNPPQFAIKSSSRRPIHQRKSRSVGEIDELASFILDSPSSSLQICRQGLSVDKQSPGAKEAVAETPTSKISKARSPIMEAVASMDEHPTLMGNVRSRTLEEGPPSSQGSSEPLRRSATTQSQADMQKRFDKAILEQPTSQSKNLCLNPLKSHPSNKVQPSFSVLLHDMGKNLQPKSREMQDSASSTANDPGNDDISQKVQAMLAATDALKAAPTNANGASVSKLTRMAPSRMIARVTQAWDRMHPKSSLPDMATPTHGTRSHGRQVSDGQIKSSNGKAGSPSIANMSPISTIEIRLNEGDNLNKKKVQKIVGGQLARKPVADDGKSLRGGKSMDDPFAEPGASRTPTTFESRLMGDTGNYVDAVPPLPRNPFDSENSFDENLEDGILSTSPVASSTPRVGIQEDSPSQSSPSLSHKPSKSKNCRLESKSGSSCYSKQTQNESGRTSSSDETPAIEEAQLLPLQRGQVRKGRPEVAVAMNIHGFKRMKKHPSPSKEALEDLQMAFRKYKYVTTSGISVDDTDELAADYEPASALMPSPRRHRSGSNRLSASQLDDFSSPGGWPSRHRSMSSVPSIPSSRLSRPLMYSEKHCVIRRLRHPYRPTGAEADEVDELH